MSTAAAGVEFEVGERLRALREAFGLSQRALARRSGVANGLISMIELNRTSPSVATLKKILDGIPMTLADFFTGNAALETGAHRPTFCGTPVTDDEWSVLTEIVDSCGLSRHELARTICEGLGWVRPNGRLKTRECYEYLEVLEAKGLVKLPRRREQRPRGPTSIHYTEAGRERESRKGKLSDVSPVMLGLVGNADERALWRELVERYHYLGHKVAFGAHLRYLVWISRPRRELCGCVQFSSAARRLQARDGFIGWDDATRQEHLTRVVNNSRFLILPWLSIKGLASHVLSLAARVVVDDWEDAYGVRPVLLETFVDRERYEGTCYLAANWVEVGPTSGRGRMDRHHKAQEPVKTCLVLPLERDFRRKLGVSR